MEDSTLVTFEVRAPSALGETVCISGDHTELGNFLRQAAREMVTDPDSYPIWRINVMLPSGIPRKYKYLTTGFKQFREWEKIEQKSRGFVPYGETMIIRDEYGVDTPSLIPPVGASLAINTEMIERTVPPPGVSPKPVVSRSNTPKPGVAKINKRTSGHKRLVLVAFHLPVHLYYKGEGDGTKEIWEAEWDHDNVAARTENSVADEMEVTWIGAVTPMTVSGVEFTFSPSAKRVAGIKECLSAMNCVPIFLDSILYQLHYSQFSKNLLWDVFHNVLRPRIVAPEGSYEEGYVPGNNIFADVVRPYLQRPNEDIVWVHDYHLMLLPKLLRARGHEGPIIFFFHVPFPTSEIFRTLPMRHEILEGILSASTIGFHTFNHGRHFLTACKRFLGAQSRSLGSQGTLAVEHRDRRVLITISHLGVDPHRILTAASLESTILASKKILPTNIIPAKQPGAIVFGSLDAMQRLKGVPMKLLAFERLLSQFSKWANGNAYFVLWTIKNTGGPRAHDVERSTSEVRRLVERINEAYGQVVFHREFDFQSPPTIEERMSLWLATDVFVSTAVAEGLNLMPLEYMLCKGENNPGVVIISEFSASSSVLNGAVRVNCYNIAYIAKAMDETGRMPLEERQARYSRDQKYITAKASEWTRHIINEVLMALDDETFTTIERIPVLSNSGLQVVLPHTVQCKPLRQKDVVKICSAAERRVFFFDFGGTLVEREQENLTLKRDFLGMLGRGLSDNMKRNLERLCRDDQRNVVFIVSGDTRTVLTRVFFDLLNQGVPLGLVAHSGLCIRIPRKDKVEPFVGTATSGSQNQLTAKMSIIQEKALIDQLHEEEESSALLLRESTLVRSLSEPNAISAPKEHPPGPATSALMAGWTMTVDVSKEWSNWMKEAGIFPILKRYTWMTVGSFYRTSFITTCWDYTFSDPEWGFSQAEFLIKELEAAISAANLSVVVKHTKSTVQLLPKSVDKGYAVRRVLSELDTIQPNWKGEDPDFCLCLGDDSSDELMFVAIHQFFTSGSLLNSFKKRNVFTATVGRKPTTASYYLRDPEAVQALLDEIVDRDVC